MPKLPAALTLLLALCLSVAVACDPTTAGDKPAPARATTAAAVEAPPAPPPPAPPIPAGWYKGNLHTHSLWSDGDDYPEHIARWYRDRGYHFLGISDHNTAQTGDKWVKFADVHKKGAGPATDRYLKDAELKPQSRGDRKEGTQEIRLAPFDEYRPLFEKPGQFILIQAEEISDKFEKRPVHMGGINVAEPIKPAGGKSVPEIITANLRAVKEQGKRLNRPTLAHLNHPNFQWGVTAEELAQAVEERFFEVYNGHPTVNQLGDPNGPATRPSIDRLWDIANTMRLTSLKSAPLFGIGTDDSHSYHVPGMSRATPGRGWTVVRAKSLSTETVLAALEAGDFYASTGVVLRDVQFDAAAKKLSIDIAPTDTAKYMTQFVGTRLPAGVKPGDYKPAPSEVGVVLATVEGVNPSYTLKGDELYVRAVVNSSLNPAVPSFKTQKQQAWTQPIGWEHHLLTKTGNGIQLK
ncbi:MAG TPA: hypothetical protein VEA69_12320 [Tepidisphaeraceae bacterium]|nr:hypothetical protein [Tepidisphaeraceae bacterium]